MCSCGSVALQIFINGIYEVFKICNAGTEENYKKQKAWQTVAEATPQASLYWGTSDPLIQIMRSIPLMGLQGGCRSAGCKQKSHEKKWGCVCSFCTKTTGARQAFTRAGQAIICWCYTIYIRLKIITIVLTERRRFFLIPLKIIYK